PHGPTPPPHPSDPFSPILELFDGLIDRPGNSKINAVMAAGTVTGRECGTGSRDRVLGSPVSRPARPGRWWTADRRTARACRARLPRRHVSTRATLPGQQPSRLASVLMPAPPERIPYFSL